MLKKFFGVIHTYIEMLLVQNGSTDFHQIDRTYRPRGGGKPVFSDFRNSLPYSYSNPKTVKKCTFLVKYRHWNLRSSARWAKKFSFHPWISVISTKFPPDSRFSTKLVRKSALHFSLRCTVLRLQPDRVEVDDRSVWNGELFYYLFFNVPGGFRGPWVHW